MKTAKVATLAFSLLCLSPASGFAESAGCALTNFYQCTEISCQSSSGGPAGETPCCKPPPYRPQLCGAATIWLPTTVYYAAPESVYNEAPDSGFASNQSVSGNYTKIGLNPGWVLFFGYGVSSCAPWITLIGEQMSNPILSKKSYQSDTWSKTPNKGHVKVLPDVGTAVPQLTRSSVDDRLFAATYPIFYRGASEATYPIQALKFSFSPYAKTCYRPRDKYFQPLQEYRAEPNIYGDYGRFLNRYQSSTYRGLEQALRGGTLPFLGPFAIGPDSAKFYDQKCMDTVKAYQRRPVYFVYSKYLISVHKATVQACQ